MEIRELRNTVTEMKNSLEGQNSRFELAELRISEFEDRSIEISQTEKGEKIEQNIQEL